MNDPYMMLKKVKIKDYKSIAWCDVSLEPLTILVGKNGSGKSNFIDALRFLSDSLSVSLGHALSERDGFENIKRKSRGHIKSIAMGVEVCLSDQKKGVYGLEFGLDGKNGVEVKKEKAWVWREGDVKFKKIGYERNLNQINHSLGYVLPQAQSGALYLPFTTSEESLREMFKNLSEMKFYEIQVSVLKSLSLPGQNFFLEKTGKNIASVLQRMLEEDQEEYFLLQQFLKAVTSEVEGVDCVRLGPMLGLEFRQRPEGAREAWRFLSGSMSDGTLRALAWLVALFQPAVRGGGLVGLEEPETALHPGSVAVLFDALRSATRRTQVLVTSHSAELLEHPSLRPEELLAVQSVGGRTLLAPIPASSAQAMRSQSFTAGELLKLGALSPEPTGGAPRGREIFGRGRGER